MDLFLLALFPPSSGVTRVYHYVELKKNWPEAQSYCRENYADLAGIENMEDWASVVQTMNGKPYALIGLYYDMTGWKWSIDETPLYKDGNTLGDWFVFLEDNFSGRDYCVKTYKETLYDHTCDTLHQSICYNGKCALLSLTPPSIQTYKVARL